jgi:hypothetical protein
VPLVISSAQQTSIFFLFVTISDRILPDLFSPRRVRKTTIQARMVQKKKPLIPSFILNCHEEENVALKAFHRASYPGASS